MKKRFYFSKVSFIILSRSFDEASHNPSIPSTTKERKEKEMMCVCHSKSRCHSSVLELRKNQFLKKINVLKTFLEIETTHYLEGLDLKLNNETYAKVPNL